MALTALDVEILQALAVGPRRVPELVGAHSRATVYRRVKALRAEGLIARSRQGFILTSVGERVLAEREAQVFTEGLQAVYPALREVPTPQHRALLELALAAVALRQHTKQDDRHAGFLIAGPTLTWKTSAGEFLALALGVDPARHLIDCRTERGQSLWIRRGRAGEVLSQRDLLAAPLAVFDEFPAGDQAVRRAVAPFLTGRRRLPLENDLVTIAPVPVVIMNPAPGTTLMARTGLSEAQLRRLIPLDVTSLAMPNLALIGRRALEAARRAGPLTIPTPRGSAEAWREPVVAVLREVLTPEGVKLIDVEAVLGLGRGLSGWFPPTVALRQALYNVLLVTETIGWTKPRWVERVRAFPHGTPSGSSAAVGTTTGQAEMKNRRTYTIALFPERGESGQEEQSMTTRDSMMPTFTLSEEGKADLVWLSRELRRPLDAAVSTLINLHRMMASEGQEFEDLQVILRLREGCADAHVAVADLRAHLELKAALAQRGLSIGDVRDAIEIGNALEAADLNFAEARGVAELRAALDKAGIDPAVMENLRTALARYEGLGYNAEHLTSLAAGWGRLQALGVSLETLGAHLDHVDRLLALGLDQDSAEALAQALDAAGISQQDRGTVLQRAVNVGCAERDRVRLEEACERAGRERAQLECAVSERKEALAEIEVQIASATRERDRLREELGINAIATAEALERFLLQHTPADDPFWQQLEFLLSVKRKNPALFSMIQDWITPDLRQRVRAFLDQIAQGADGPAGGNAA